MNTRALRKALEADGVGASENQTIVEVWGKGLYLYAAYLLDQDSGAPETNLEVRDLIQEVGDDVYEKALHFEMLEYTRAQFAIN